MTSRKTPEDPPSPTAPSRLQISLRPRHGAPQLFDLDYASNLMACVHARLKQIVSQDEGDWRPVELHVKAISAAAVRWLHELAGEDSVGITAMSTLAVALK